MTMIPARTADPALPGLLAALAAGQQAALRGVYDRQATRLYGVANAILRGWHVDRHRRAPGGRQAVRRDG
jgi:hypothetical protein